MLAAVSRACARDPPAVNRINASWEHQTQPAQSKGVSRGRELEQ